MNPKRQRALLLLVGGMVSCLGVGIILYSFQSHIVYFYTPTQLQNASVVPGTAIRLGGLVELGSVETLEEQTIRFTVTDLTHTRSVRYTGLLPTLFREGQGVVAEGTLQADGSLIARTILAKHDENYMPPEVAEALKASGRWQHYGNKTPAPEAP